MAYLWYVCFYAKPLPTVPLLILTPINEKMISSGVQIKNLHTRKSKIYNLAKMTQLISIQLDSVIFYCCIQNLEPFSLGLVQQDMLNKL